MPVYFSEPQISTTTALGLTFLFAFSYVGSLYLSRQARLSFSSAARPTRNGEARRKEENERWRDDPDVIKARLASVSLATLWSCAMVTAVVWYRVKQVNSSGWIAADAAITRLGLHFGQQINLRAILPHLVTPILFLGPLHSRYLLSSLPFQRGWSIRSRVVPYINTWQGVRNYMIAPITEEIVFRACVLAVYQLSGSSTKRMIFLSPLSFGAAHIHHAWDTFNRYGRTPAAAKRAIFTSLFQLAYTTIFGFHCAYLFLRTGSILPPITAHIFCNVMGLPQIGWELSRFPTKKAAIILSYIVGVVAFIYTLGPLTLTANNLYWMDAPRLY